MAVLRWAELQIRHRMCSRWVIRLEIAVHLRAGPESATSAVASQVHNTTLSSESGPNKRC